MNRAIDTYALRQTVISKNIANATSPHYRPEAVKFEEFFNEAQSVAKGTKTDERHISLGGKSPGEIEGEVQQAAVPKPEVYFSGDTHVNIDKEMSKLAENQIRFRYISKTLKSYFQGLNNAITGFRQ